MTVRDAFWAAQVDFPHRVFLKPLARRRLVEHNPDLTRLREIRGWCLDQLGECAVTILHRRDQPENAFHHGGFLNLDHALCTYNADALYHHRMYEFRFKDDRHATIFKLYAY
jgi:hypothetical protein